MTYGIYVLRSFRTTSLAFPQGDSLHKYSQFYRKIYFRGLGVVSGVSQHRPSRLSGCTFPPRSPSWGCLICPVPSGHCQDTGADRRDPFSLFILASPLPLFLRTHHCTSPASAPFLSIFQSSITLVEHSLGTPSLSNSARQL
ncbi:hypothetical protein M404DRAFT_472363 [Pisolithus tinctorius Marx 270]|uniref:Uncharacterized protein n=1 Tax=Pisolithus tinctorius Marx 270 TaxID=870435 RepID=A0A0C3PYI4_PISTI|nr:hypothetical protein M404DRAFT_472363 [Pisolithus tinctorius Marx 270]